MSLEVFLKDIKTISRLRHGPCGKYLDSFAQNLQQQGYCKDRALLHIRIIRGFAKWLQKNHIPFDQISSEQGQRYRLYRTREGKATDSDASALRDFIAFLKKNGCITTTADEAVAMSPAECLVAEYVRFLYQEQALAAGTVQCYRRFAQSFLDYQFGNTNVDCNGLGTVHVIRFVRLQAPIRGKRAKKMVTALRSFLRYLLYKGLIDIDLATAVPSVAQWSMTSVPKCLSASQVELFLSHSKGSSAVAQRDHAMFLLLARLGLRAAEVVSLTLDDIDWQESCITVHGKGGHCTRLPLPADVGQAIAEYLTNGRTPSTNRTLFLRLAAPIAGLTTSALRSQIKRAQMLCGFEKPRKSAHQFRHSLASEMLRQGASLGEIAEILRHRSTQSTEVYAKVDFLSLMKLSLPWPGGVQ